ncbi:hypothetical protein WN944_024099 [Citrus x changshan-huyou]|uniref:Uncharacterized protein n=1 Tax=Citrus x changshan-huyou TaxID=2935761 RepID=A0AAP0QAC3_9ROSI
MGDASLVVVSSLNDSRDTLSDSDNNYYEYDYSSAGSHEEEAVVWALRSLAVNSYDYYLLVLNHGFLIYLLELLNEYKRSELASCPKWRMEVEEDINLLLCVFVMNMKMIELHCLYIVKPYVLYIVNLGYSVMRRISSGDSSALF